MDVHLQLSSDLLLTGVCPVISNKRGVCSRNPESPIYNRASVNSKSTKEETGLIVDSLNIGGFDETRKVGLTQVRFLLSYIV